MQGLIASYAENERSACARRLEVAAQWMDEAAVYTIHGWCNRMLRQHAFDSGSLFKLEIETADTELLNEVAAIIGAVSFIRWTSPPAWPSPSWPTARKPCSANCKAC